MAKLFDADGNEVEAFLPDELNTRITEAVTAKEAEYTPKVAELTEKLTDAEKRAQERSGEFAQFRKLSDEAIAKLGVAERTIYENGLALQQERERNDALEKRNRDAQVDSALRAKAGTNEKLLTKMKDMWSIIAVETNTPEEIDTKIKMVLGAIGQTEPDLVATVNGFQGGSFTPPVTVEKTDSYADSDAGKAAANELGLLLEVPTKK